MSMFTGIIRHVGTVTAVRPTPAGRSLRISLGPLVEGLRAGDSVAVCGACLTASDIDRNEASFDVIAETLSRTRLGNLAVGSRVNLERSLTLADALDGHLVQGHVDGLATVRRVRRDGGQWVIELAGGPELTGQMVPKGSVAIDGVSLTLAGVSGEEFSVALIPTTLAETTLGDLTPGDEVNIETDVIGKYVQKYLHQLVGGGSGNLSLEKLRQAGFA